MKYEIRFREQIKNDKKKYKRLQRKMRGEFRNTRSLCMFAMKCKFA